MITLYTAIISLITATLTLINEISKQKQLKQIVGAKPELKDKNKKAFSWKMGIIAWILIIALSFTVIFNYIKTRYFPEPSLIIHGSTTIGLDLIPQLAESYLMDNLGAKRKSVTQSRNGQPHIIKGYLPDRTLRIDILPNETDNGIRDLINGICDIAMASRPITEIEKIQAIDAKKGNLTSYECEFDLGLDFIIPIINSGNEDIDSIDVNDLSDIFSGEKTHWIAFSRSAPSKKIKRFVRDKESGTHRVFENLLNQYANTNIQIHRNTIDLIECKNHNEVRQGVSENVSAIGYVSSNYRGSNNKLNVYKDSQKLDFSRHVYLYLPRNNKRIQNALIAKDFISYIYTETAKRICKGMGYKPLDKEKEIIIPEEYLKNKIRKELLPITLYFSFASAKPNPAEVKKAIKELKLPKYKDRDIFLSGFTDDIGSISANIVLSSLRAQNVWYAFKEKGIECKSITGYGERYTKDLTETERKKNRCVEIWLGDN